MKIEKKIEDLFELRRLPYLIGEFKKKKAKDLKRKLVGLQIAIYSLDSYLESEWKPTSKRLKKYWKEIFGTLKDLGYSKDQAYTMCSDIRRYEKHELQLREQLFPTRLNMEYYYHYKSCDVRLIRNIIYDKNPNLENLIPLLTWRYFDLITEVNDDIEDVFEDQLTINGNMFLISVHEMGIENAKIKYLEFFDLVSKKFGNLNSEFLDFAKLMRWFEESVDDTKNLLNKNCLALENRNLIVTSPVFDNFVK